MAIDGPLTLVQWKAMNIEYKCPLKAMHFPNLHRQHLERAWNRMTCRLNNGYRPPDENRAQKARELRFARSSTAAGIDTYRQRAEGAWVRMTCRLIDPSADST